MNLDVPGREWSRAGKRLEQHRSLGGNASKYKMASKKRRTENPATRTSSGEPACSSGPYNNWASRELC